jgi:copper chaperone CopZ
MFCKAAVAAKLKQVPGVIAYDIDLKTDSATVLYDPTKVTVDALIQAIIQAGFQVKGIEELPK